MTPGQKEFVRQVIALLRVSTPDEQRLILAAIQDPKLRQAVERGIL